MVTPSERGKKKKFRRTPGGKTKKVFKKGKRSKKKCSICKRELQGTAFGEKESKNSLSEKRPSAPFGGKLCNICRAKVFEEALKVKEGVKKPEEVEVRFKKFAEQALKKIKG